MGGLIQDKRTLNQRGVPIFYKIPVFGFLFGFKEYTIEKSELVLLITPRVVGTPIDAQRITDEMRRATPELNDALRKAPRPPGTTLPAPMPGAGSVLIPAPPPSGPPAGAPPSGVPPIPPAPPPP